MKDATEMTYMEWLELDDALDTKVKEWYLETYPTDECGHFLSDNATFRGLYNALLNKDDVYDYIGEGDSVIRERCFSKLSNMFGIDYNHFYHMWLSGARA